MDSTPSRARSSAVNETVVGSGFASSPWVSAAEFAVLRAHPRLPAAVGAFASSMIELHEGSAFANAILGDRGRLLIGLFVLYLEVLPLPGTDGASTTLTGVQALCRRTRLCSAGRAASVLAAMRFGGYLTPKPDPGDHRRRILVPTQRLIAAHRERWVRQFEAMAPVFPASSLVPTRLAVTSYRTAFLRHLGAHFLAGFRVLDHAPVLAGLAESNAGLLLMSSLVLPELSGSDRSGEKVPISISALSRRFGVSRAHVRNMLDISARAGLLVHAPGWEDVVVLPALVEALIQFYGVLFLLFDRCAALALRDTGARAGNDDPLK